MHFALGIIKYFPHGGLQRDFMQIAKALTQRGHAVTAFTPEWRGEVPAEIDVNVLALRSLTNHGRRLALAGAIAQWRRHHQVDGVVGFNEMPGLDFYFAARVCLAEYTRQRSIWYRLSPRHRSLLALERVIFGAPYPTDILSISPREKKFFIKHYQTPAERFHDLPPGITKDRKAPPDAPQIGRHLRAELGLPSDAYMLLMVGSGFKTKGADRAIRALHALPPPLRHKSWLYVLGNDNPRPFERLARKLNVATRVHFLGGRDDVPRFFFAADLLLHPAYAETAGMVLIEAMAASLPILVTDVCGYAFHVAEAQAGIVLPSPFDQKRFDAHVAHMLTTPQRLDWRQNGRRYIERTEVFSLAQKAAQIIESLTERRNRRQQPQAPERG
jgi:UDP-glucose:(heptosyl)LPS alpha-1,3-glucosyltransferase